MSEPLKKMLNISTLFVQITCFITVLNVIQALVVKDMESLLSTHKKVIDDLEGHIKLEKKRLNVLETHLELFKNEHKKAVEDIPKYFGNPLNRYTLTKRLTADLEFIEQISEIQMDYKKDISQKYPMAKDLDEAIEDLTTLQRIYQLNITKLANGVLNSNFSHGNKPFTEIGLPMTASDCFYLGAFLNKAEDFKIATDWFMEVVSKYDKMKPEAYPFTEEDLLEYIAFSYVAVDDVKNALKWTKKIYKLDPEAAGTSTKSLIELYEKRIADEDKKKSVNNTWNYTHNGGPQIKLTFSVGYESDNKIFKRLCSGQSHLPSNVVKRLKCRYLSKTHPFLKLAPIKVEQLYINPEILMFHEALTGDEMHTIQEIAKLKIGSLQKDKSEKMNNIHNRFSETTWLNDNDSTIIDRVTVRLADFIGINVEFSDRLQVTSYGTGGPYEPHYDFLDESNFRENSNVGKVLLYLSNVEGGATVFTRLGLTVHPVKGSAIFWRNQHPSGEVNETRHAECPVLTGWKWVASKFIYQRGEEFTMSHKLKSREYRDRRHLLLKMS